MNKFGREGNYKERELYFCMLFFIFFFFFNVLRLRTANSINKLLSKLTVLNYDLIVFKESYYLKGLLIDNSLQ